MKKIIIGLKAGFILLAIALIIGSIIQFFFPSFKSFYLNPLYYISWDEPIVFLYFIEPFIVGIILAFIWSLTKDIMTNYSLIARMIFVSIIYLFIALPGIIISNNNFPISTFVILIWGITILTQSFISGYIFSKTLK